MAKSAPELHSCPKCHSREVVLDEQCVKAADDSSPAVVEGYLYFCRKCCISGPLEKTANEARLSWNRMRFDHPMGSSSCKEKGSGFEREMCRRMSLWLSGGETDDLIWRNKGQPNRRIKGVRRLEQFGDAHSTDPRSEWFIKHFNLECKFYKDLDVLELLDKPEKKGREIFSFWEQACRDAKDSGDRVPMLIMKRNSAEITISLPFEIMLGALVPAEPAGISIFMPEFEGEGIRTILLKDFESLVTLEVLKRVLEG